MMGFTAAAVIIIIQQWKRPLALEALESAASQEASLAWEKHSGGTGLKWGRSRVPCTLRKQRYGARGAITALSRGAAIYWEVAQGVPG